MTETLLNKLNEKDYIKSRVDDQIKWYDAKSTLNQKMYKRLKFFEIFFSVSIPVLTAIQAGSDIGWILYLIGLFGALIALFSGILSLNKYHEKWINFRTTAENLKRERIFYITGMGPFAESRIGKNRYPTLVERIEAILANENTEWGKYMMENKDNNSASESKK
ncbi:MAG: hypothetical protein CSA05_01230 [Bacteroidia bacterium]|nr:MAG: hypothetical protein CSA05_01230 [Bacteroidia bacterium]